jgi:NitT/TauT family transport system substrate-binding protein
MRANAADRYKLQMLIVAVAGLAICRSQTLGAEPIIVSNYGVAATGMPYAVALKKGFFAEANANVDAIIDAEGAIAIRKLVSDRLAYAEVSPKAASDAAASGMDVRIISGNVYSLYGWSWMTLSTSPVGALSDLKGRRLGYSTGGATSETLDQLMIERTSLPSADVPLIRVGGVAPLLTYLQIKGIDAAPIPELLRSTAGTTFKVMANASDVLPPMADVVGVTTLSAKTSRIDFILGVLKGRQKAVEFIRAHPADAASAIADVYHTDPATIEKVIRDILAMEVKRGEVYWDPRGSINLDLIQRAVPKQRGGSGDSTKVDVSRIVDESVLVLRVKDSTAVQ